MFDDCTVKDWIEFVLAVLCWFAITIVVCGLFLSWIFVAMMIGGM